MKRKIVFSNHFIYIGLNCLCDCLEREATHVFEVDIHPRIEDKEIFKRFSEQLKSNKPKKGRKGKGKKGGKKKKK